MLIWGRKQWVMALTQSTMNFEEYVCCFPMGGAFQHHCSGGTTRNSDLNSICMRNLLDVQVVSCGQLPIDWIQKRERMWSLLVVRIYLQTWQEGGSKWRTWPWLAAGSRQGKKEVVNEDDHLRINFPRSEDRAAKVTCQRCLAVSVGMLTGGCGMKF